MRGRRRRLTFMPVAVLVASALAPKARPGGSIQAATWPEAGPIPQEPGALAALQGVPGATAHWWAAVQQEIHPPGITGLSPTPTWTGEADQARAFYGCSVATAGDVNGDGYSDLVAGAPGHDEGETDKGRAVVYLGSPGGLAPTPDWAAEGNQAEAYVGVAVGTAGDVNGDGYSDLVVAAPVSFAPTLSVTTFTAPDDGAVLTFTLAVSDCWDLPDPTPDEVVVTVLGYRYLPLLMR